MRASRSNIVWYVIIFPCLFYSPPLPTFNLLLITPFQPIFTIVQSCKQVNINLECADMTPYLGEIICIQMNAPSSFNGATPSSDAGAPANTSTIYNTCASVYKTVAGQDSCKSLSARFTSNLAVDGQFIPLQR